MIAAAAQEQEVSLTASTPPREEKIAPTTCSEAVEHEDRASAPTPTSLCLPHGPACGAASGSQNDAIFIPSDSESESESCEADEDVPSLRALNALIDKGTTTKPNSTSPAPTMPTVPYTPRAVISSLKVDDDLDGAVQHSPPPASLTTSAPQRQGLRNGLDSSRCSASISTAEAAEQDHEQAEDANEPLSSPCGNHGPSGPAELPRQTQPHESGSQNDSASIDADGNTADDGDRHSSRDADSDSSSDRNSGSDGDDVDDDYDDDGSPSDTDGEDGSHSKKRKTGRSPSVTGSDDGHADGFPSDDKTEEIFRPWSHKRQKLAHDREDTTPVRRQNSMPCSAGRLSQSPRRPQTASMLSPPASDSLSESESDKGSECSKASAASFGEWLLQNAALKCVTIDGVTTYQLQFQRAQAHSCGRQRETRPHRLVRSNKRGRKPRDETKGRRCGVCNRPGHNARTCQKGVRTSSEDSSCES